MRLPPDVDADVVARASALRPLLAQHATRSEEERQVVPEVMEAMESAGLFEVLVPKRVGGLGGTLATQLAVAAELARACPSSAWVQSLLNVTTWAVSRSPGASDLFDASGASRPRVCGVAAPNGTATPGPGGYRVSGKWPFASGSFYASWFTGGVMILDAAGEVTGVGMALMPRSAVSIEDTWFVAGMCGTASNTVVAEDVLVASDRVAPLLGGDDASQGSDPSDRWPLGTVLALVLVGPLLGAAQASANLVIDKAPKRALSYTSYGATTESMVAVSEIAHARLDIDSAKSHVFEAASYVDAVGAGAPRNLLEEARVRGQCGYLTELLRRAVDTLLNVAGAGAFAETNTLQRYWRDLNVGSRHAFLATNLALETYGRALFDLDPVMVLV